MERNIYLIPIQLAHFFRSGTVNLKSAEDAPYLRLPPLNTQTSRYKNGSISYRFVVSLKGDADQWKASPSLQPAGQYKNLQ